ncbi:MAG: response receiver sensor histidine kinase response regulator [Verrucomicrobiales bacterium]|nr:response receiver sensor histidine kinase response regulator [Verrucomicrobiales bacterium]
MQQLVRVLLIDDNPDDRLLALRELRREFSRIEAVEVSNPKELVTSLDEEYDLVITDFQLLWTDGLVVLRTVKNRWPKCPVIMFTGTGSEEIAVEAMKSGLSDYVLKSPKHYVRLAASARTAMENARSQHRAAEMENRFQKLLERLDVGIFRATIDGLLLQANPAFLKLVGWKAIQHDAHLQELYFRSEIYADHVRELKETKQLHECEMEFCRADGSPRWISMTQILGHDSNGDPIIDGLVSDISERVLLEEHLRKTQKMDSIGQLAAGVAHDFNNLLTIIQGHTNLILEGKHDPDTVDSLKRVAAAADRATTLTRQLLTFGRRQRMAPEPLNINEVVKNVESLLRHGLGDRIFLEVNCEPDLPEILADASLLEQVVVNLAMNGRDAMQQGGVLSLTTNLCLIDRNYTRRNHEAEEGSFVCLKIEDTGCGIDAATLSHLFEPFYTTKDVGKGPGLGLASVYGIVKQHKGWIDVASRLSVGTTFSIYLPCAAKAVAGNTETFTLEADNARETVLVVEDEPELLDLVAGILESNGYQVLQAASGVKALDVWHNNRDKIDLLLTDMKMPEGMDGIELAEILMLQKPLLKVLYTSGYSPALFDATMSFREDYNFLSKPYPPEKLLSAVRNCLTGTN